VLILTEDWRLRFQEALPDQSHLLGGDANGFHVAIESINLRGGQIIPLQQAGVTALVGANNAGKSTILREVWEKLTHRLGHPESPRIAVESLTLHKKGAPADVIAWMGDNASFVVQPNIGAGFQRPQLGIEHPIMLVQSWSQDYAELGALGNASIFYGDAQGRFAVGGTAEMRDSSSDAPQHPVHYLQDSSDRFENVRRISREIFGVDLTLDTLGRTLRLRVGSVDMEAPRIDNIPREYRDRMSQLRPLDNQGDGMRSLMGQLLPIVAAAYKVVIIDEPEAFLHPPQAHALGVELGRIAASSGIQIVLATHDRNLLTGLLESEVDVSVVRLNRREGYSTASRLDADQLRELWTDPVLRYTNVLDGLFHRLVVIAEAEGDCAFLAAAVDAAGERSTLPRNEILFVPTGGKDGMSKVCAALNAVDVAVIAAPDLDMLSDQDKLERLVRALGGTWTPDLSKLWNEATSDLRAGKKQAKVGHVLDALTAVLEGKRDEAYTAETKEVVQAALRTNGSTWGPVKEYGVAAFKGQARTAAIELLRRLGEIGLVLVEAGELEHLAPEIAVRKGSGWLQAALESGAQRNPLSQAHVSRILDAGERKMNSEATASMTT